MAEEQKGVPKAEVRRALLAWYGRHARDLPWRRERDPYRIWLSEVMLQQTRIETVIPYYGRFLRAYPSLKALSAAGEEEVLKLWEGLGYYTRARNFLAAVKDVQECYGGRVPADPREFRGLPGVGDYTQAAVMSIAYDLPLAAVDGNIRRVISRLLCLQDDPGKQKPLKRIKEYVGELLDGGRPGDVNQALMDLGASVCVPRNARCSLCPLADFCLAKRWDMVSSIPRKKKGKPLPVEEVLSVVVLRQGKCLVRRRPGTGLLGGLWEFPTIKPETLPPSMVSLGQKFMALHHRFSHLCWKVTLYRGELLGPLPEGEEWRWISAADVKDLPFPALYQPVLERLLPWMKGATGDRAGKACGRRDS